MTALVFVAGLVIGSMIGIVIMGLCAAARERDAFIARRLQS
jgi:hypothetical protein